MKALQRRARATTPLAPALVVAALACSPDPPPPAGPERLLVLMPQVPQQLDPHADPRLDSQSVLQAIFDPLLRSDEVGALRPVLLESWSSPEPTQYRLRLREGLRFHDGTRLEAAHVVASVERVIATGSYLAGGLVNVSKIEAAGPHEFLVRTHAPVADLVFTLSNVAVVKPDPAGGALLGSGPFRPVRFEPGRRVELKRHPGFHGPPPFLDEITIEAYASAEEALARLQDGTDVVVFDPPLELVEAAARRSDLRRVVQPSSAIAYLAFGLETPTPFRDRRVRHALRYALDLPRLAALEPQGEAVVAGQLVPRGVLGYEPELAHWPRDLDEARRLLAEAGHGRGFDVVLDTVWSRRALAEAIAGQLAEVGVRVEVHTWDAADFTERIEAGSSFYLYSWVLGLESGKALSSFFHTHVPERRLGLRNRTGYSNPEVDRLLVQALGTESSATRAVRLRHLMRVLMDDLPWLPLTNPSLVRILPASLALEPRTDGLLLLQTIHRPAATKP